MATFDIVNFNMNPARGKGLYKFIEAFRGTLSGPLLVVLLAMRTGLALAQNGEEAQAGTETETKAQPSSPETEAQPAEGAAADTGKPQGSGAEKGKISSTEFMAGTLPPRKTSAGAFLMLGFVAPSGFLLGGDISIGWKLIRFLSIHVKLGAGGVQKRGGGMNTMVHGDILLPVRLAICSHSPRVCPGLDFYVSVIPGIGYGLLMQNKTSDTPFKLLNHSVNAIVGLSLESIRTYGNMDAGVRFGVYIYIDFLKEQTEEEDPWLAYALFELGIVVRWGKAG
jgi:hypothetical protein